jgi:hypothetical protein
MRTSNSAPARRRRNGARHEWVSESLRIREAWEKMSRWD